MNQILMIDSKKKKKNKSSGPIEIANIVRFFAVTLIIFGLSFIGQGSYAIYRDVKGKDTSNMPVVSMERVNDRIVVTISGTNIIENIIYSWNNSEETKVPVEDTYVEEEIILPFNNSVLNLKVEEETGRMIKYKKEFIVEGLDISQPDIKVEEESTAGNIKITAIDETEMSHITYKINDEEEVTIEKTASETTTMNYIVKLPRGENKIIITATDTVGNTEILEKTIIVSGKSNIRAEVNNGKIIFIIDDPDGVKDIEINLNGLVYAKKDINAKEVRVPLDLATGNNTISVKVTNVNSLVTTVTTEYKYGE